MKIISIALYLLVLFFNLPSCTQPFINNDTDLLGDQFFQSEEDYIRFTARAYTGLRQFVGTSSLLALQEISSDEVCLPIRGDAWNDGGVWQRLHQHTWQAYDPVFQSSWSFLYQIINDCNRLIALLAELDDDLPDAFISEIRALRAICYMWLLDAFGNVPLITSFEVAQPSNATSHEVYNFIESELLQVIPDLTKTVSAETYGRINYYAAQTALARLYLNAGIYKAEEEWAKTIQICDEIINDGQYSLTENYFSNFSANNASSSEIILAIPFDEEFAPGFNLSMATLHPSSQQTYNLSEQPWNGWCALEDFFSSYDSLDLRKGRGTGPGSFVYGLQYTANGDTLLQDTTRFPLESDDPDGIPVHLTPKIRSLTSALNQDGARIGKFEIPIGSGFNMSNDFPVYRYAQILMMKAEALWRLGQIEPSLLIINQIRSRSGLADLTTMTGDNLLAELGKEFFMEGHRRTDLIRFGKFNDEWWEKPASEPCKNLFPIPFQIGENPNLVQNPCY